MAVGDAIDDAGLIEGDQQGAVGGGGYAYGTAIDQTFAGVGDEAGEERNRIGGRLAILEGDESDLIAGALGAVPGAVLGDESAAVVAGRELFAAVESELKRSDVGAKKDIGDYGLGDQVGFRREHARVHVAADVAVRPAVEAAVLNAGQIVGRKIIAEAVAFVDGNPGLAGDRLDSEADGVAKAG